MGAAGYCLRLVECWGSICCIRRSSAVAVSVACTVRDHWDGMSAISRRF